MAKVLFGAVLTLVIVAGFYWLPGLIPSAHWPSFWAGVVSTLVTGVITYFAGVTYILNHH